MKSNLLRHSLDISKNSVYAEFHENKSLKLQVNELKGMNKICRERNKLLERQIEELNQQIFNLNKMNRKLLYNSGITDANDIENLYIASLKKEISEAYKQIDYLQLEVEKGKKINEVLLDENQGLKNKIMQYRKYVAQLSASKADFSPGLGNLVEVSEGIFQNFTEKRGFHSIIEVFDYTLACLNEISSKNLICVTSNELQKVYFSDLGGGIEKMRVGKLFLYVHGLKPNEKTISFNLDQIQDPKYDKEYIQSPGFIQKNTDFVIVCKESNKGYFNENDLKVLTLFTNFISKILKIVVLKKEQKGLKKRIEGTIGLVAELATAQSLDKFANLIDKQLASFFDFETAGIVFVDNIAKEFFIFGYNSRQKDKFSNEVIRLPLTMGITSEAYNTNSLKIYQNIKQKAQYSPEIDNIAATGDIKNCIMMPLIGPEGKPSGILQICNKINGKINDHDCNIIREMSRVLGFLIYGIAQIEQALDLTTKMKTSLSFLLLNRNSQ